MRNLIISLFVLCLSNSLCAQDTTKSRRSALEQTLFSGSHLSVSLIPHLAQKAGIKKQSGPYELRSAHMEGMEAGANYHFNFNKNYSLIVGLHGGASARNYLLHIPKEDFPSEVNHDYDDNGALTRTFDFYLSAPLLFERRWTHQKTHYWNLLAGVNVRFYPDEFSEFISSRMQTEDGRYIEVVSFELEVGNGFKPWLNYNVGGGYTWLLGNHNLLRLNLLGNLSAHQLVKGSYRVSVPGKPLTQGTYSANLSYVGLSVNYIFTAANKRLRKLYEKQLNYR